MNTTSGLKKWESTYRPRHIRLAEKQAAARERNSTYRCLSCHKLMRNGMHLFGSCSRKAPVTKPKRTDNMARVYLLRDPFTQEILYIGQTTGSIQNRKTSHISMSHYSQRWKAGCNRELYTWLQTLLMLGTEPIVELIAEHPAGQRLYWEKKYIVQYAKRGHKLFNRQGLERLRKQHQAAC